MAQRRIIITEAGVFRESVETTFLGDGANIFAKATQLHNSIYKNFVDGWSVSTDNGETTHAWRTLPSLTINTEYAMHDGITYPAFDQVENTTFQCEKTWKPPEGLTIYFGVQKTHRRVDIFLFGMYMERMYRLPLGNLYSEGRLCMGNDHEPNPYESLINIAEHALESFERSPWNYDLFTDDTSIDSTRLLFGWDEDDNQVFSNEWANGLYCVSCEMSNIIAESL